MIGIGMDDAVEVGKSVREKDTKARGCVVNEALVRKKDTEARGCVVSEVSYRTVHTLIHMSRGVKAPCGAEPVYRPTKGDARAGIETPPTR